jgi:hypothetical protein
MSHSRTLNIMILFCDYRWPVLTSLFPFVGLVLLARESEREREGDRDDCLRHWESYSGNSHVRRRPAR